MAQHHEIRIIIEKETKGAVQYKEVNADGSRVEQYNAVVGTLYVRKSAMKGIAKGWRVTLDEIE